MELNRTEAASALGIDPTTLDAWTRKGAPVVERQGKGKPSTYRLADLVAWRIETALAKAEAAAPAEDLDTLRARKLEIENERRGLELAKLRGELVEAAEVSRVMHGLVAGGRAHVLAIAPSRIAAAVADGESPRIAAQREIAAALTSWAALGVEGALAEAGAVLGAEGAEDAAA